MKILQQCLGTKEFGAKLRTSLTRDILVPVPVARDLVALLNDRVHDGWMGRGDLTQDEERGVGAMFSQESQEPVDAPLEPTLNMAGHPVPHACPTDRRLVGP